MCHKETNRTRAVREHRARYADTTSHSTDSCSIKIMVLEFMVCCEVAVGRGQRTTNSLFLAIRTKTHTAVRLSVTQPSDSGTQWAASVLAARAPCLLHRICRR
eukprot:Gregarina_sp_Pseudo_9__1864@NODE_2274_length_1065_cov_15_737817_g2093_i0_p3_GENE_NODE_2274_length_1065_cov_15_737817_g2093_i0NODE_2274_length_1065_cov_15_737817_g2093_i0_p3_ORF_typecomplete_len103_score7_97DUF3093/PF11292_8/0_059PARP/PF00644_20/0_052_NODE_2274_length_1065_cov_15_737817_g2093_i0111419